MLVFKLIPNFALVPSIHRHRSWASSLRLRIPPCFRNNYYFRRVTSHPIQIALGNSPIPYLLQTPQSQTAQWSTAMTLLTKSLIIHSLFKNAHHDTCSRHSLCHRSFDPIPKHHVLRSTCTLDVNYMLSLTLTILVDQIVSIPRVPTMKSSI